MVETTTTIEREETTAAPVKELTRNQSQPVVIIGTAHGDCESFPQFVLRTFRDLNAFRFALATNVVNVLSRRYRRSVLGFAWSLLNPLLTMVVMSVVFAALFRRDLHEFAMFVFSGNLPWQFISAAIISGTMTLVNNETFLKKLYTPKAFFPLANVCVELFNFTFSLISLFILGAVLGLSIKWTVVFLPLVIGITFVFLVGLSLIAAISTVYFRDINHIIAVLMSVIFYAMPILYPPDQVPKNLAIVFECNPFYHFIKLYRHVIYDGVIPGPYEWLIPSVIALVTLTLSLFLLKKTDKDIVFRL